MNNQICDLIIVNIFIRFMSVDYMKFYKPHAQQNYVCNVRISLEQSLSKKNYSKLSLTVVYYTSKLWFYGTLIYNGKLWYYGQKYGTMDKTRVVWTKLGYYTENYGTSIYKGKKHERLPKTLKL